MVVRIESYTFSDLFGVGCALFAASLPASSLISPGYSPGSRSSCAAFAMIIRHHLHGAALDTALESRACRPTYPSRRQESSWQKNYTRLENPAWVSDNPTSTTPNAGQARQLDGEYKGRDDRDNK